MTLYYTINGEEFQFEIEIDDLYEFFKSKTKNELVEIIFESMDESDLFYNFEDELKEYFEDDAERKFEAENDPLGSVGMSQSDFI